MTEQLHDTPELAHRDKTRLEAMTLGILDLQACHATAMTTERLATIFDRSKNLLALRHGSTFLFDSNELVREILRLRQELTMEKAWTKFCDATPKAKTP